MNNEPVAWIDKNTGKPRMEGFIQTDYDIPLYTHPAKTLTDEYCKAYWGKDNCFVDVFLPDSETEVIRFWNNQLNESYEPKTLTDGEILKMAADKFHYSEYKLVIDFARAILRKAQEK